MESTFFQENRKKFGQAMADESLAVFFSGIFHRDTNDQLCYPFSVDRNFYYFTGIDKDHMILLFWKNMNCFFWTAGAERGDGSPETCIRLQKTPCPGFWERKKGIRYWTDFLPG